MAVAEITNLVALDDRLSTAGQPTAAQLAESLGCVDRDLPADIVARIDAISLRYLYPLG